MTNTLYGFSINKPYNMTLQGCNGDSMLEIVEEYILGGIFGFIAGVFVTRLFFKHTIQVKTIGKVIEWAMIEKKILQLGSMSTTLNQLISDIKSSAEEVTEKQKIAQDIEVNAKKASTNLGTDTGVSEIVRGGSDPPRLSTPPSTLSEDSTSSDPSSAREQSRRTP
jgi:hypothetical protein